MKIDNQRNTYRIWLSRLVMTVVFALIILVLVVSIRAKDAPVHVSVPALPEIDLDEVDPRLEAFGRSLSFPLIISSMTGGDDAMLRTINRNLAMVMGGHQLGDVKLGAPLEPTYIVLQVPFEDPSASVSSTAGPTAASRITCLSCHRAHATSAPAAASENRRACERSRRDRKARDLRRERPVRRP